MAQGPSGRLTCGLLGELAAWGETLTTADELRCRAPAGGGVLVSEDTLEAAADGVWGRRRAKGPKSRLAFTPLDEAHTRAEQAFVLTRRAVASNPFE